MNLYGRPNLEKLVNWTNSWYAEFRQVLIGTEGDEPSLCPKEIERD